MKVELTPAQVKPFHLIHPATTFCPKFVHEEHPAHPGNVWLKLAPPNQRQAVNLKTGDLLCVGDDVECFPVDMKVVENV